MHSDCNAVTLVALASSLDLLDWVVSVWSAAMPERRETHLFPKVTPHLLFCSFSRKS